jgi:hypothetical protein
MKKMAWEPIADKMLSNINPLFDHLKLRIKEYEKAHIKGIGFAHRAFDDGISCQDVYTNWYDEFFGLNPDVTSEEAYDLYAEATGRLIMFPVMDVYKTELKTNVYAKDILKIWDMNNEIPDAELLESDHRENFKLELRTLIREYRKRDKAREKEESK